MHKDYVLGPILLLLPIVCVFTQVKYPCAAA